MSALQKLSLTLLFAILVSITGPAPSLLNYERKKRTSGPRPCSRLEFMEKCRRAALRGLGLLWKVPCSATFEYNARMIYNRIGRLSCRQSEKLEKFGDGAKEKFFHSSDPYHEWRKTGGELDHFHFERRTIIQSAFDRPGVINLSSDMLVCFFSLQPATRCR